MKKYLLLFLTWLAFTACREAKQQQTTQKQPNVIIVITDDQGYGDLGHNGNKIIKTPSLDKFSTQSVSLTNYHVGTTCAPTRAGLMTARNCNRNGVWHTIMGASILNREEVTMADVFKQNGYATGMFGKWHLGDNHPFLPEDRGFDEAFYHGGGGIGQTPDYWNNDYFDDTYFRNGKPEKKEGYCTDIWFDEAIKFVENNKEKPFLCYLSLNAPHGPYNVPEEYYNIYKESPLKESQKRFYGMITNIDNNFLKLDKKLNDLGIADNTILIFTTDNGTANGIYYNKKTGEVSGYNAGMRGKKASEYDGGHRVPFIVRWKDGGLTGGKKLSELVAHVDILPTLASLTNITFNPTKTLDGIDLSKYLLGTSKAPKRYLVTDTQRVPFPVKGKQSCVMDTEWRLVKGNELYHITEDIGQKNNVADKYPEKVKEMQAFYDTWWADIIKESKFSKIDIGVDKHEVITCHDAHIRGSNPPWNQKLIRKGKPMSTSKYLVNFVKSGKYKFNLQRWAEESGLALGQSADDIREATAFADARVEGKALRFNKAFLKVGEQKYEVEVDNNAQSASFEIEVNKGETDLYAYFELEDGTETNAFYVYIDN